MRRLSSGPDTPVAELVHDTLRENLLERFRSELGTSLVQHHLKPADDLWLRIDAAGWQAAGAAAKRLGLDYFCFLSAMDWLPSPFGRGEDDPTEPPVERSTEVKQGYAGGSTRFQLLARLYSIREGVGVTFKCDVPESLVVDTWVPNFAGANWHERETWEMFGITFAGHPDLRHMYLPGDFEGYPLRKDFPLLARIVKPWPGIVDVEPIPPQFDTDADAPADAPTEAAGDAGATS